MLMFELCSLWSSFIPQNASANYSNYRNFGFSFGVKLFQAAKLLYIKYENSDCHIHPSECLNKRNKYPPFLLSENQYKSQTKIIVFNTCILNN